MSDLIARLDFAGIGIIWVLRVGPANGVIPFDRCLLWALGFLAVSLVFAVFQYAYATVAWAWFSRRKEVDGCGEDAEVTAPGQINWPTNFFLWSKVAACVLAYTIIVRHIGSKLVDQ